MPRLPAALEDAACKGWNPVIFDATCKDDAVLALQICGTCLVRAACLRWMQPNKRFYSGVAGGKLWDDGRHIKVEQLRGRLTWRPTISQGP